MSMPALPKLLRFLLVHAAIGFAIAGLFVMALVGFDIGGFGSLVGRSSVAPLALGVLTAFLGLTFASVQMGVAIMLLPKDHEDGRGGGSTHPAQRWLAFGKVRLQAVTSAKYSRSHGGSTY